MTIAVAERFRTVRAGAEGADLGVFAVGELGLAALAFGPGPLVFGIALYAAAVVVRPWLMIPLVVTTLPFYLHPRILAGQELSGAEAAILVGGLAVICRGIAERALTARAPGGALRSARTSEQAVSADVALAVHVPRPSPVDWGAAAIVACALLSLLVTEYPRQSLRELRWLIVEPIAVFYLARATLGAPRRSVWVFWSVVAAGVVAAIIGVAALAASHDLAHLGARATAPYLSPNQLGMLLSRAAVVSLAFALFAPTDVARRLPIAGTSLAVTVIGLLRTLSLGAWGGFVAGALVLAALKSRRAFGVAVAGTALILAVTLAALPAERTLARWDPATGTALFRVEIWRSALHMIADHPLLGLGMDNFLYAYQGGYREPEAWREPNISHPHNWVLDFWLQLGLPGLAAAVALLGWSVIASLRLARTAGPVDRLVGAAALGLTVALLTHGSVDNSYFLVDSATIWWIALALLIIHDPESSSRSSGTA